MSCLRRGCRRTPYFTSFHPRRAKGGSAKKCVTERNSEGPLDRPFPASDSLKFRHPGIAFPAIGTPEIGFPAIGFPEIGFPAIGFPAIGFPAIGFWRSHSKGLAQAWSSRSACPPRRVTTTFFSSRVWPVWSPAPRGPTRVAPLPAAPPWGTACGDNRRPPASRRRLCAGSLHSP